MLIAVSADGRELSSAVSKNFESCCCLLLINTDESSNETAIKSMEAVDASEFVESDALARLIVERDCEAVITGALTPACFNIIADGCVTRYSACDMSVIDALVAMDRNQLDYIRYADENDHCHGEHSGGECNCDGEE